MDENKIFDTINLAQDDSFIQWVQAGKPPHDVWTQWKKAHPTKTIDFDEAILIVEQLKFHTPKIHSDKIDRVWTQINDQVVAQPNTPKIHVNRKINIRRLVMISAAAVLLLLAGFFFIPRNNISIHTDFAQKTEHQLPDGSMVFLNADSKLTYNKNNWDENRFLTLEGEAFFEVEKGNTFKVNTSLGDVQVLGTSFNVRVRESFQVDCFTGKVEVTYNDSKGDILTPGKSIRLESSNKQVDLSTFEVGNYNNWRSGAIHFKATKLSAIFKEMERQYNVRISASETIKDRSFTGIVDLDNIASSLTQICPIMNLSFEGKGKRYRIVEK